MCLIAFIYSPTQPIQLKLVANRDEFYARPTAALAQWMGSPIVAGQDLHAGGTWLGVTANGRMAALTNHRNPSLIDERRTSRGALVSDFLAGDLSAADYFMQLRENCAQYNPFNLLCFDGHNLLGFESRTQRTIEFEAGTYAVSNADFDSTWPKSIALKNDLNQTWIEPTWPSDDADLKNRLFAILGNAKIAPDEQLPNTGIDLLRERALSAAFIDTPDYGTRASTIVAIGARRASIIERSFKNAQMLGERTMDLGLFEKL